MPSLTTLVAREVFDAGGRPTLEVEATTSSGAMGRVIVPSGGGPEGGSHEATELRDGDPDRLGGEGVLKAAAAIRDEVARRLVGMEVDEQAEVDAALIALDGTERKARLGANAILGASLAVARAAAVARGEPLYAHLHRLYVAGLGPGDADPGPPALPMPMITMISGGSRSGRNLDFRGFLVVPLGAGSFREAITMSVHVYRSLGRILARLGDADALVGRDGGYGPSLRTNAHAVDLILEAIVGAGLEVGRDAAVALDVSATRFYHAPSATYRLAGDGTVSHDSSAMMGLLAHWVRQYPIVSIGDGLAEDDWNGWSALTRRIGGTTQLVGDDMFVAHRDRIGRGFERRAANAVAIAPGRVGTLSETFEALRLARRHGYRTVIATQPGETEDTTVADLAVATGAGQIQFGSVSRSERLAKYNRLLRIEDRLGPTAPFVGRAALGLGLPPSR